MKKVCNNCKEYVANEYGSCPECWSKIDNNRQREKIALKNEREKGHIPSDTLLKWCKK